jgi:hypothetical protein
MVVKGEEGRKALKGRSRAGEKTERQHAVTWQSRALLNRKRQRTRSNFTLAPTTLASPSAYPAFAFSKSSPLSCLVPSSRFSLTLGDWYLGSAIGAV